MNWNILSSLIVNCSRVHKARPTACLTYFHLRRTSVVCVLVDTVTSFPYVSIVFVKTLLFPDAYFIFLIVNFSVWFAFLVLFSFLFFLSFFQHLRLSFVLIERYEIYRSRLVCVVSVVQEVGWAWSVQLIVVRRWWQLDSCRNMITWCLRQSARHTLSYSQSQLWRSALSSLVLLIRACLDQLLIASTSLLIVCNHVWSKQKTDRDHQAYS